MARRPSLASSPAIEDAVGMMHAAARQGSSIVDVQTAVADALGVLPAQVAVSVEQGTRTSIEITAETEVRGAHVRLEITT